MDKKRHDLVLGLDPGIASCGFALLDMTDHKILEMGTHLFDTPQEDKTKVSLAVTRRAARSSRRNNLRTKNRQKHCLELLQKAGLVPQDATKSWFQSRKGDLPLPRLRAEGLDHVLTDRQFAKVLYVLSAHRGYIPHGEVARKGKAAGAKDVSVDVSDAEEGKVLRAVAENAQVMQRNGYRTVGEMFYKQGRSRNQNGDYGLCVTNAQIQAEVHAIFDAQRSLGNPKATKELEDKYIDNLTWEQKTLDHDDRVYRQVGFCGYFPTEPRAAKADLSSELCNAYERFGHLVMVYPDGNEERLTAEQRKRFIDILFSPVPLPKNKDCKVTYELVRRTLDLSARVIFKGESREDERQKEVYVPKVWRRFRQLLPEELLRHMLTDREFADDICESVAYASTADSLRARLVDYYQCPLSTEELDAVLSLPYSSKVFNGYGHRSRKALGILLDEFTSDDDAVLTLNDAEYNSGLRDLRLTNEGVQRSELLPPYVSFDPTCKNPVVLCAMGRMRHIVNSIIRIYGVPNIIRIELGRDLKQSKREKAKIEKLNKKHEAQNKVWRKEIAELRGCAEEDVTDRDLLARALYEEQGQKDVYTEDSISLSKLFTPGEECYCEIDHVLPYSRTCDDSRDNKVLVLLKSNQDKHERTPYEWMTSGETSAPSWSEFSERVRNNRNLSPRKRAYMLNMKLDENAEREFLNRNLNDDRYMSRAVKSFIEQSLIFPDDGRKQHVFAVAGGATAQLRHVWGLNFGAFGQKDRSDDRHHAVDACVIAACGPETMQKIANASKLGYNTLKQVCEERFKDTQPWTGFADEIKARREFVIPTRMVDHGVTGRVFEDTNYRFDGFTGDREKKDLLYSKGKESKEGMSQ